MKKVTGTLLLLLPGLLLLACASRPADSSRLSRIPATDAYCLEAQRIVTRTTVPMELVVHEDFNAFVKSKALIMGPGGRPEIQQFDWHDADGNIQGISCKMKNAEHLQLEFGAGMAGPEGYCHDMNQALYDLIRQQLPDPVYTTVIFDPNERNDKEMQRNQSGPEWLLPFTLTTLDAEGSLHIATKGFVINFTDPRYQRFPASWRGTHYCHLIAPEYLTRLLEGKAQAGAVVGRKAPRR